MNTAQVTDAHIARVRASGYTTEKGVQMAAQFIANNEIKLAAEREKVRMLRSACESICEAWGKSYDAPFCAGNKMETLASKAIEKLEDEA